MMTTITTAITRMMTTTTFQVCAGRKGSALFQTLAYFNPMVETSWNSTWNDLADKGLFIRDQDGKPYQFLYIAAK